jgi:Gluconate 2-dehydrogenase subunit 3
MIEYPAAFLPFDRRSMLERMAFLLGAVALPVEALAAPEKRTKRILAAPQLALLTAVADTILPATDTPGAIAAQVPARLDGLLASWASADTRTSVTSALTRIESSAKLHNQRSFATLSATERSAVLRPHDAAALAKAPPPPGAQTINIFAPASYVVDPGYLKLKELVISLYYYSEIASATELIYKHVPGQWQPSIKLTPASRPYLGVGPF